MAEQFGYEEDKYEDETVGVFGKSPVPNRPTENNEQYVNQGYVADQYAYNQNVSDQNAYDQNAYNQNAYNQYENVEAVGDQAYEYENYGEPANQYVEEKKPGFFKRLFSLFRK